MTKSTLSVVLVSALILASCGKASKLDSQLNGHFEGSSSQKFTQAASTQRATAEWEPSRGVVISQMLLTRYDKTDMAKAIIDSGVDKLWIVVPRTSKETLASSSLFRDLRKVLGKNIDKVELIKQQHNGEMSVWARDWAPQGALTAKGELRLLDFNYFPERDGDDFTAQTMERLLKFGRVSVPLYNEGGNFMTTEDGVCFMTSRVTDANEIKEIDADLILSSEDIQNYYKQSAACQSVHIFPRMPYEGTGHIDMWAKFLDNKTLIVGEIRAEILPSYLTEKSRSKAEKVQKFLNDRAGEMEDLGFKVIRMPMPGPIFDGKDIYRSYTNSLTVNGLVLVPRYVKPSEDDIANASGKYFDQKWLSGYEQEVKGIYESAGYAVRFIDSDEMIYNGGAVHCTTMQLPR